MQIPKLIVTVGHFLQAWVPRVVQVAREAKPIHTVKAMIRDQKPATTAVVDEQETRAQTEAMEILDASRQPLGKTGGKTGLD